MGATCHGPTPPPATPPPAGLPLGSLTPRRRRPLPFFPHLLDVYIVNLIPDQSIVTVLGLVRGAPRRFIGGVMGIYVYSGSG